VSILPIYRETLHPYIRRDIQYCSSRMDWGAEMLIQTWVHMVSDLRFCILTLYERMLIFARIVGSDGFLGELWG